TQGQRFAGHSLSMMPMTPHGDITHGNTEEQLLHNFFPLLRSQPYSLFGGAACAKRTARMARRLTRSGYHTGEIHGRGIRNKTSGSRSDNGQRTVAQSTA